MKKYFWALIIGILTIIAVCVFYFGTVATKLLVDNPSGWAAVLVAIAGNILLVWTIRIGTVATDAATRAAKASEQGLEIGQRAYIQRDLDFTRLWNPANLNQFEGISIEASFINRGSTPAVDCSYEYLSLLEDSEANTCTLDKYRTKNFTIFPNERLIKYAGMHDQTVSHRIVSEKATQYLLIKLLYSDVFQKYNRRKIMEIFKIDVSGDPKLWSKENKVPHVNFKRVSDKETIRKLVKKWEEIVDSAAWNDEEVIF